MSNDFKYYQCAVYMIVNPIGQKYVGGTTNLKKRYLQYKNSESTTQAKIIGSINKYGFDAHKFIVLEYVDKDMLDAKEHEYGILHDVLGINGLNSMLPRCNANFKTVSEDSIERRRMYKPTKETLERMSKGQKGRKKHTEETRIKLRNANLGKKQSEETKLKKSLSLKGRIMSEETKLKMSISSKGKKMSEETKEKLRLINKGREVTQETRRKISLANIGRVCTESTKSKIKDANSKKIIDLNTGILYNSATELASILKIKRTTLTAKLSGQNKNNTQYVYC